MEKFEAAINEKTKAVIINSPNNPSGVVYTKETIEKMCDLLRKKEKEYGHSIFVITDEPYRELVYDDIEVPYIINYYHNTFVCYSTARLCHFLVNVLVILPFHRIWMMKKMLMQQFVVQEEL